MRLAVISDIHGNVGALNAVLEDITSRDVDAILNLGDICSGPLYPSETVDRLMAIPSAAIQGNHERQLLAESLDEMGASDRFARERLRGDQLDWLRSLPPVLQPYEGVLMVHGSPNSDLVHLLATVRSAGLRPASVEEIEQRIGDADADLVLCGHTHLQRSVRLPDGRLVVNPGSVGLQAYEDDRPSPYVVEAGTPHARYAVVERAENRLWTADLLAVEYDWEAAAREADARLASSVAVALRTGRAG